jgi:uncharacterized SAM-binding protein YcdF (DUF218 family)
VPADRAPAIGWWRRQYSVSVSPRGCALAVALAALSLAALAGAIYVARAPLLTWIGQQLVDEDPPAPSDAIVVLAGGTPEREIEAASLFASGLAPRVVLPRGPGEDGIAALAERHISVESIGALRVRVLHELGVPDTAIVRLEPVVISTISEAALVADWAGGHGIRSLIVVSSAFHTARVKRTYRRVFDRRGVQVRVRAARTGDVFRPDTWWHSRIGLTTGLIEWQKRLVYQLAY